MPSLLSAVFLVVGVVSLFWTTSCAGTGACVGTGGVLSSPECKAEWSEAECEEWNDQEINGATWIFHGGDNCEDLGYSEECSDNSFRRPGAC